MISMISIDAPGIVAEYLCGRIMRFGLHHRIASDFIFGI